MIDLEEIKLYLPKYLAAESEQNLFKNLKDVPDNIDSRMYSSMLLEEQIIYQGDGLEELLIINLPDSRISYLDKQSPTHPFTHSSILEHQD